MAAVCRSDSFRGQGLPRQLSATQEAHINVPLAKASQDPKSVVWGSLLYSEVEVLQCYITEVFVHMIPLQEWGQELGRVT